MIWSSNIREHSIVHDLGSRGGAALCPQWVESGLETDGPI
jgi:hypothetical protein